MISAAVNPPMFTSPVATPRWRAGAWERTTSKAIMDSGMPMAITTATSAVSANGAGPGQASSAIQDPAISPTPPRASCTRCPEKREITGPKASAPTIEAITAMFSTAWAAASE
ncbi:hypothetical protein BK826_02780 [Rothia kristinae]|uniref:Uncharacterized protein n=1 Tax=Rothia kristinae TaxID=37923 RepID=A0A1S2N2M1_9MICC|nr:hypothetical protein BK826_02780 [Rothia kristinae]